MPVQALCWQGDSLHILDQRLLPHKESWIIATAWQQVAEAITVGIQRRNIAQAVGIDVIAIDRRKLPDDLTRCHVDDEQDRIAVHADGDRPRCRRTRKLCGIG